MASTTDLSVLKINYLTQAQYDSAKSQGTLEANEIYMTPVSNPGVEDVEVDGVSVVTDGVAEITMPTVPTKVSQLQNDSGFITGYTETDPTVPNWAKQSSKPSYTASEVGAAASSHAHGNITNGGDITATAPTIASGDQIIINDNSVSKITNGPTFDGSTTTKALTPKGTWETFLNSYTETDPTVPSWAKASSKPSYTASEVGALPDTTVIPSKVSDLQNDSGFITGYTETDPTVPSWAKQSSKPTYTASEVGAVPTTRKVNGKALSSDITLSASDVSALPSSTAIPSKTSDLTNDSGFITGYTETDPTVPSWAKAANKPTYTASEVGALPDSTSIPTITVSGTNLIITT